MITPELIGPYLAYSPTLETLDGRKVLSLDLLLEVEGLDKMFPGTKQGFYENSTLCLLPFSAISTPIEDDSIPAVEVAKIMHHGCNPGEVKWIVKGAALSVRSAGGGPLTTIYGSMISGDNPRMALLDFKAADYLRSRHFAVGLSEGQYIPLQP